MKTEINALVEAIKADYRRWHKRNLTDVAKKMIEHFEGSIEVTEGKKYIKIVKDRSVWGFVVNVDNDKKFRKGDILKPATFSAPTRNFARGNVFDGIKNIRWTSAG